MTSTTTSAKAAPGGKPSAGKTPITKKQILILCGIAGGIALIVGLWFLWQKTRPQMPRLSAPTPVLARYVNTEDFEKLPFDMRLELMRQLETRNEKDKREMHKAYAEGHLSESDYRGALQMAWFGKHLTRVYKYASQNGQQKQGYLDELILKSIKDKELDKKKPGAPRD